MTNKNKKSLSHNNIAVVSSEDRLMRNQYVATIVNEKYMLLDKRENQIYLATLYLPDADMKKVLNSKIDDLLVIYSRYGSDLIRMTQESIDRIDELENQGEEDAMRAIIERLFDYSEKAINAVLEAALVLNLAGSLVTGVVDALFSMCNVIQDMAYAYIGDNAILDS